MQLGPPGGRPRWPFHVGNLELSTIRRKPHKYRKKPPKGVRLGRTFVQHDGLEHANTSGSADRGTNGSNPVVSDKVNSGSSSATSPGPPQ